MPYPAQHRYTHCPVLYLYWVVMDCTVFVSDLYCIPDDDTKTVLLSTVFLQLVSNSIVFVSAFYCIPKTCTNTVLSSTVFIPAIRYPVSVYGTGWYRNDVQNGTVRYLSNTVYREFGIGTVPVSTVQQYWNGTVQYHNVYWVGLVQSRCPLDLQSRDLTNKAKMPLEVSLKISWQRTWMNPFNRSSVKMQDGS